MTPPDDLSPPRRPMFFLVVIATVFLTIIGMAAGLVLGERHKDRVRAAAATGQTVQPTPAQRPTRDSGDGTSFCPDETRKMAAASGYPADLRQVLKIVTRNGTTAWICEDPSGALYYQGKTGGVDAELVQNANGLFLDQVRSLPDPERYEALAHNGTILVVSRTQLEVRKAGGETQIDEVVTVE